ncbi:MAG TPA: carboxypeptidase regulatory-like domain-containing protein [Candidatus Saccharimonadales bacterium]|nr:carboxypeptidase regulatory-like domain-containing protein [Candidatus Saccharimonadales bacterium]
MRLGVRSRALLVVCLLSFIYPGIIFAQTGTTSIRGVVTDKSGAVIVGASVRLTSPELAVERTSTTSQNGQYEFVALKPGTYSLSVESQGFRKYDQKNIELLVNTPTTLNVVLNIGESTESVEVSAQAETLNTTDATLGVAFGENQVKQLPLESRNVGDLLSLQAGVVYTGNNPAVDTNTDTRSGSVNGSRSDQSNVTLDGIPVNPKGGYAFQSVLPVTLDSVEEFRVTTTNADADEGSAGGAQVALVTKSGTNNFHGSVYEYNRNSYFSANDYFLKTSQLASGDPNKPQFLNRNIFGGSLGGPVKKDRLFFFLNYEGYRDAEQQSLLRIIPSASLRDGVVFYACDTTAASPNPACSNNPSAVGASGQTYTANFPGSFGGYALSPSQLKSMDPLTTLAGYTGPVGPNQTVMTYFQNNPLPNDYSQGDGYNTAGYRFAAPTSNTKNWYIAKLDYNITKDGKQRVSLTGALANQDQANAPFLPGQAPETSVLNFNKGLIANYSAVIKSNLVNNFRYGFVRESLGTIGNTNVAWNTFRGIQQGINYSSQFQRPTNSFWDDLNWSHGKHTFQFGFQTSFIRNPSSSTTSSFSNSYANAQWLDTSGLAGRASSPLNPVYGCTSTPAGPCFPAVDFGGFGTNYDNAVTALFGMAVEVNAQYNYARDGSALAQGAPVVRHYAENGYEMYAQDSWKLKPSFTLTLGLRYSLFSPPWETKGLEVAPTESLNTWFNNRGVGMNNGVPSIQAPLVAFNWAGPANGGTTGYYGWDYKNLGPRVSFAWSPGYDDGLLGSVFGGAGRSSIRGGFGMVYDRVGEGLLDTFDANGAFGLSTSIPNAAASESVLCTPRITQINGPTSIPQFDNCPSADNPQGQPIFVPAPPANFPVPFPSNPSPGSEAITWGLDNHIKTPYSYTLDFAVQRELKAGFSVQVAYVGRLSHRLLIQGDVAMPLNPYDKKAGMDYFKAATAMAKLYRSGVTTNQVAANPSLIPANVQQYWQDITQPVAPGGAYTIGANGPYGTCVQSGQPGAVGATNNPAVLAFDLLCANSLNESLSIYEMDTTGIPDAANPNQSYYYRLGNYTGPNVFYSPQYSSLYALRTISNASYNAMQVTLQHKMSHGIQFDVNYTYGKSIDLSSDAERVGAWGGLGGQIINSFDPGAGRAVSDFDLRHQFNTNFVWDMPFGQGKWLGHDVNKLADAFIGGWQLSGLIRLTSGFPVTVDNGGQYPTNYQLEGHADQLCNVKTGIYFAGPDGNGGNTYPNLFANGAAAASCFGYAFPGETGARNNLRGPGFFGIDMGVGKRWKMPWSEAQSLQFRWEVFNITNSVRFDVQSLNAYQGGSLVNGNSATFGNYSGTLTNPRIMQFALRYEF